LVEVGNCRTESADRRFSRMTNSTLGIGFKNKPGAQVLVRYPFDGAHISFVIRILLVERGDVERLVVTPPRASSGSGVRAVVDGDRNSDIGQSNASEGETEAVARDDDRRSR